MQPKIIPTEDGSHSLYIEEMEESYHSVHGAVQESTHVFINAGLSQIKNASVKIFEVGFGTGLNALLTWEFAQQNNIDIKYFTLEKYPIKDNIWKSLNFGKNINSEADLFFQKLHSAEWNKWEYCSPEFQLFKAETDWLTFDLKQIGAYDLVYFDAFAPNKQPEMWGSDAFKRIFDEMSDNGILVTYCAKGQVRRDLQAAGFSVERIPGPPGKREMLRARKAI